MKYSIEGTIPTQQYGNIRPTFTIENEGEESLALEKMEALWAKYGEKPLRASTGQIEPNKSILVDTFTGEKILYDDSSHKYYTEAGVPLVSGSAYADSVSPKFDKGSILPKTAKSWNVTEKDLDDIWQMSTDISTGYGTAIHKALEAYHKYHEIGAFVKEKKDMEFNYVLPKNKFIRDIVRDFVDKFGVDALSEVMVSDVANLRAGQIDRLQIVDPVKKVCRVGDYKTNNDLDSKKLKKYQHQLSFYAHILSNKGWVVEGLDIFHHNGEVWERIPLDVLDLII